MALSELVLSFSNLTQHTYQHLWCVVSVVVNAQESSIQTADAPFSRIVLIHTQTKLTSYVQSVS